MVVWCLLEQCDDENEKEKEKQKEKEKGEGVGGSEERGGGDVAGAEGERKGASLGRGRYLWSAR
jgi:hypothetical protein